MSQIGQVVSAATWNQNIVAAGTNDGSNWAVDFTYALDAGGNSGPMRVVVGAGIHADVALWSSASSTISVPLNKTPGTSQQVLLLVPPLIKFAAFGVPFGQ